MKKENINDLSIILNCYVRLSKPKDKKTQKISFILSNNCTMVFDLNIILFGYYNLLSFYIKERKAITFSSIRKQLLSIIIFPFRNKEAF